MFKLRDLLWNYPNLLYFDDKSIFKGFGKAYTNFRPFSHIISTLLISIIVSALLLTQVQTILGFNTSTFIEGEVVGVDEQNNLIGPDNLHPLLVNNNQIDKDIIALTYEPLLRVNQDGSYQKVLAQNFEEVEQGVYRFKVKKDVTWHDGEEFTAEDVIQTFNLIKELGQAEFDNIYSANTLKDVDIEQIDTYTLQFSLGDVIVPNFYEIITFYILPSHLIDQYRDAIFRGFFTGNERLTTIGTGPFILNEVGTKEISLLAFEDYHLGKPQLEEFKFKLYANLEDALNAMSSGELHGLANFNSEVAEQIERLPNFEVRSSDPIYTQYWGLYFNLSSKGKDKLQQEKLRRGVAHAINRQALISQIYEDTAAAYNTIPPISEFHAEKFDQRSYDPQEAAKLLQEYEDLKLNLIYVDNLDREKVVTSIKSDLAEFGIEITPIPLTPEQLSLRRSQKEFDLVLTGVNTFVDPDRYEFFHSSQITDSDEETRGSNISGYQSDETTAFIEDREVKESSLSDKYLDDGRKTTDLEERKEVYRNFQELLYKENPVIYLYHPVYRYALSTRVRNVDISEMKLIESRFDNVHEWKISL